MVGKPLNLYSHCNYLRLLNHWRDINLPGLSGNFRAEKHFHDLSVHKGLDLIKILIMIKRLSINFMQ